jgi:hypothetical protein
VAEPPTTFEGREDETMTSTKLKNHWLRTKRHLRSVSTSPRALRDADRALAAAARAADEVRECLCRRPALAA